MGLLSTSALVVIAALLLDHLLGEPRRWHPLVGFGRLAMWLENRLNRPQRTNISIRLLGGVALVLVVGPLTLLAWLAERSAYAPIFGIFLLYLALGWRSLQQHVEAVATALDADDLNKARAAVGRIVSRNTDALDTEGVARAATESALENGSDALFGALFWYLLFGLPGVVGYRLVNTLDAMWGYRTVRYRHFGWAAARLDDLLNLVPARLTAVAYALAGNTRHALCCWWAQARHWDSPNAGPVMAAGGGALEISLGGPAMYAGEVHQRPELGVGSSPNSYDIHRALRLIQRSLLLWLAFIVLIT